MSLLFSNAQNAVHFTYVLFYVHTATVNKNTLNGDSHELQKPLFGVNAAHLNLEPFVVSWTVEVSCAAPAFLDT